jgi:gas vesicle protein
MMEQKSGNFLTGLLTGALVGASLAMVLGPVDGQETRDLLRAKAREGAARTDESPVFTPANEI